MDGRLRGERSHMLSRRQRAHHTVGPGTPMGNLMRQYWLPALLSRAAGARQRSRARAAAGRGPDRVSRHQRQGRPAGEQLPHRGASLFFGRNEEEGLRCVYHGWKFDADGMRRHAQRAGRVRLQDEVKAVAYPTQRAGRNGLGVPGAAWPAAAAGPRSQHPTRSGHRTRSSSAQGNWMQVPGGDIDTSTAGFLHYGVLNAGRWRRRDRFPNISCQG